MRPLHEQPQVAVLFDATCREVFEAVARSPASAAGLSRDTGISSIEIHRCLEELVGAGLVAPLSAGRYGLNARAMASIHREIEKAWVRRLAAAFIGSLALGDL